MVRNYRLIALLLVLISTALNAQDAKTVSFDFRVFGIGRDSYDGLFFFDGSDFEPLQFHRTHRSFKKYAYSGEPSFDIFVSNPDFNPANQTSAEYVRVSRSNPISVGTQLIIFAANANNREAADVNRRFTLFHVDDSQKHFGRNSVILLNATGANLFGRIDGEDISLPIGASDPIPYEPSSGKSVTRIAFALATKEGARLVMSNDIEMPDNRRLLIILEPPRRPNSYRVAVRVLSESVFQPDQEEQ